MQRSRVSACLERACLIDGTAPAVMCGETVITHRELRARCAGLTAALRGLGLAPGDRVAVCAANCHRVLELFLAVPSAGLIFVPIDPRLTLAERRAALERCRPAALFAADEDAIAPLRELAAFTCSFATGYEELLGQPVAACAPVDANLPAALFFTGGTTGTPKAVTLSHANLVANARHYEQCVAFSPRTRWLIAAPMSHVSGTMAVLATLRAGGCSVVLPQAGAAAALDAIEQLGVTATLVVPTTLAELADLQLQQPRDVASLAAITHGGSPVTPRTLSRATRAFPAAELVHLYGATETAPIATALRHEQGRAGTARGGSCGRAVVGVTVTITDPEGRPLPANAVGEIRIAGPNVMLGYWEAPEATAAALDASGTYRTGDLGYLDEERYLYVVDRLKDVIVSAGCNIHCPEVEDALTTHPAVREAAVFAVPHPRDGEAVHAVVVLDQGADGEHDLRQHCAQRLAAYKVPAQIDVLPGALPRSAAGKVDKRALRTPFWRPEHRSIGAA